MEISSYFLSSLKSLEEMFRKDVAYGFIKSYKKAGPHPLL